MSHIAGLMQNTRQDWYVA